MRQHVQDTQDRHPWLLDGRFPAADGLAHVVAWYCYQRSTILINKNSR